MNLRISYFSDSQFNWVALRFSLLLVFIIKFFRFILKVSLFYNEMLNFQIPGLFVIFFISLYGINRGEWSLKKAGKLLHLK